MKLSDHLEAGKGFPLDKLSLHRFGYEGDLMDTEAVVTWLRSRPILDFEVPERTSSRDVRPDQDAFRRLMFSVWAGTCPLTGCSEPALLEAAHLDGPGSWRAANFEDDGILLRVDLHRLFDAGLMSITRQADGLLITVSEAAAAGGAGYSELDGKVIRRTKA